MCCLYLCKKEYLRIFFLISSKPYVIIPHLNLFIKTVQMRGHNICFYAELTKNIPNYHQIFPFILISVCVVYKCCRSVNINLTIITGHKQTQSNLVCYFLFLLSKELTFQNSLIQLCVFTCSKGNIICTTCSKGNIICTKCYRLLNVSLLQLSETFQYLS